MPEVKYKFKSSLAFETAQFSEPTITVGALKDIINQKQSIKTNGFDLKLKDCDGRVYNEDEEMIDTNSRIIVSRFPKLIKPVVNSKRKEHAVSNILNDSVHSINEVVLPIASNNSCMGDFKNIDDTSVSVGAVNTEEHNPSNTITIPDIPDFLKCSLCKHIMKNATKINCCKNNFCYGCITGYLFDPEINGSMECPDCKCTVSNDEANVTENVSLREMIVNFQSGKWDAALCVATEEQEQVEVTSQIEIQEQPVEADTLIINGVENIEDVSNECVPPNPTEGDSQDVDIDNDTNLFEDHLLNQISLTEVFHYEIPSYPPEIPSMNGTEQRLSADINELCRFDQGETKDNVDQLLRSDNVPQMEQCQMVESSLSLGHNASALEYQPMPDIRWNVTTAIAPTDQSIKNRDFDPVLYMKFLKIVGENYPDELRKILSSNNNNNNNNNNNIIEPTHTTKGGSKSTSSRHRSRDREDNNHFVEMQPALKRSRREDVGGSRRGCGGVRGRVGGGGGGGNNDNGDDSFRQRKVCGNIMSTTGDKYGDSRQYNGEENGGEEIVIDSRRSSNRASKEPYQGKSNGVPMTGGTSGGGSGGRRHRSRSREMEHARPRQYYQQQQQPGSRYIRAQEAPAAPYYNDDRRRLTKTEHSSSSSYHHNDKQKYDRRRSDR